MHSIFIHFTFLFDYLYQIWIQNEEFNLVIRVIGLQIKVSFQLALLRVVVPLEQVYHIRDENLLKAYFMI